MRVDIKTFLILALTIAVIVLSTCNSCKQKKIDKLTTQLEQCKSNDQQGKVSTDTVIVHDTIMFSEHAPIPTQTEPPKMVIKRVSDTVYLITNISVDTANVDSSLFTLYSTNYYSKKFKHKYGTVTTFDTVYNNRLIGNGLDINLSLPIVTKTVYQPIKKAQFYFGIDAFADKQLRLTGAGASFLYITPKSLAYRAGAYFTDQSNLNYNATLYFPLTKK